MVTQNPTHHLHRTTTHHTTTHLQTPHQFCQAWVGEGLRGVELLLEPNPQLGASGALQNPTKQTHIKTV